MSTVTDFLIDISDNMDKKLNVAKGILVDEIAPSLDYSEEISMRTFLSVGNPIIINRIDLGKTTKENFLEKLSKLPWPNGGTPTAMVMQQSISRLSESAADWKRIVLITSGKDTDGGDYSYEVDKFLASNKGNIQVNIVGFDLSGREEQTARDVASKTHGVFCNVSPDIYNDKTSIRGVLKPLLDILSGVAPAPISAPVSAPAIASQPAPASAPAPAPTPAPVATPAPVEVETRKPTPEPVKEVVADVEIPKIRVENVSNVKTEPSPAKVEAPAEPEKEFKFEAKTVSTDDTKVNVNIDESAFDKVDDDETDDILQKTEKKGSELAKSISEVVKNILNENADTVNLLKNKIAQYKSEIDKLRAIGKESLKEIDKLIKANSSANGKIDTLQSSVNEASNIIDELKKLREKDKVEITNLRKMDEQVIVQDNVEERHANSRLCEKLLYDYLLKKYPERVKWINEAEKQTLGYDFEIRFDNDEVEYYIACKGIKGSERTFFLNKNEWDMCLKNNRNYQVYLINEFMTNAPKITVIDNLMGSLISGRVKPYTSQNKKVKANSVMFSLE